jgi:hypothetical protein
MGGDAERRVAEPEVQRERTRGAAQAGHGAPSQGGRAGRMTRGEGQRRRRDYDADRRGEQRDLDDPGTAGSEPSGEIRTAVADRGRQRQDDG